jgi:hypothetical protein
MDWKKTIEAYDKIMSSETFHRDRKFREKILLAFCNDVEMQAMHNHEVCNKKGRKISQGHPHRKSIGSYGKSWLSWRSQRHGSSGS